MGCRLRGAQEQEKWTFTRGSKTSGQKTMSDHRKLAKRSCGDPYLCIHSWPDDCKVQCGGDLKYGFFFEAYPRDPGTFLRGNSKEGIAQAEQEAWDEFVVQSSCSLDHTDAANFERRDYTNGVGFCTSCGFFASQIFPPSEICCNCGKNTYNAQDNTGDWWCEECEELTPEDRLSASQKWMRKVETEPPPTDEELFEGIHAVCTHIMSLDIKDHSNEEPSPDSSDGDGRRTEEIV